MEDASNHPLVTIGIVCYKAENFIIETLNSVYHQTYDKIELIVSDDHSPDNTVQIIKEWLCSHKSRFVNTLVIESDTNTGPSGNGNRAIFQAHGEWYKSLDGDDILKDTAITDYVEFVNSNKNVNFVFGRIASFQGEFDPNKTKITNPFLYPSIYKERISANRQYNVLLKHFLASGTSGFYRTSVLKSLGGYDERFPFLEDYPLLIKYAKNGNKLWLLDKITLYYRIVPSSISHYHQNHNQIFSNSDIRSIEEYKYQYLRENYGFIWKVLSNYSIYMKTLIIKHGNTMYRPLCRFLYTVYKITDPYKWYEKILLLFYR